MTEATTVLRAKVPGPGGEAARAGRKGRRGGSAEPDHACGCCMKGGQDKQGKRDTRCIPGVSAGGQGEWGPPAETREGNSEPRGWQIGGGISGG